MQKTHRIRENYAGSGDKVAPELESQLATLAERLREKARPQRRGRNGLAAGDVPTQLQANRHVARSPSNKKPLESGRRRGRGIAHDQLGREDLSLRWPRSA